MGEHPGDYPQLARCHEVGGERGLVTGPFLSALSRTGQDRFPCHPALQWRYSAGSDFAHLVLFPIRMPPPALLPLVCGFPTLPGGGVTPTSTTSALPP